MCQELAGQLQTKKRVFEEAGVRLVAIGIGNSDVAAEFSEHTQLSPEILYADPTNAVGSALDFPKGVARSFGFTKDLSSYKAVFQRPDNAKDLVRAALRWKIWLPPAPPEDSGLGRFDYGIQQGGVLVFAGDELVFEHRDPSSACIMEHKRAADVAMLQLMLTCACARVVRVCVPLVAAAHANLDEVLSAATKR